ncbi:SRPBCC family protein [Leekyejoonella antrihumi]|uniref:Polyketide cyclase n=1 Tax=Leekyejoonella antrihumi TaxID=1660198 RepID=A0A563DW73_9MICO|nr:SRPBCC family protein [Leekyejoonella antrihumi]TWP34467.1 polyketide cyclase [Leekyejoonella antrihumi]
MRTHQSGVERLAPHQYVFRSTWQLPAPRAQATAVLADLANYPRWWPQFKTATQPDADNVEMALRSVLPITLRFTLHRDVEDHQQGLLRATATGDIDGTVEWAVTDQPGNRSTAAFTQAATLTHPIAVKVDRIIRPVLEWNHAVAMRSGAAGIAEYLDSDTSGPSPAG